MHPLLSGRLFYVGSYTPHLQAKFCLSKLLFSYVNQIMFDDQNSYGSSIVQQHDSYMYLQSHQGHKDLKAIDFKSNQFVWFSQEQ